MLIHIFGKKITAAAANIADVSNIQRNGFKRAGAANRRVQAI
jgi:hypothetical protein